MPVLERLIAEVEPNVITKQLTRECIQVRACLVLHAVVSLQAAAVRSHTCQLLQIGGADHDATAQKKRTMLFSEIECLVFSYKGLAKIDSLQGLENLTKLQLDNNYIQKIENLSHLVGKQVGACCITCICFAA